MAKVRGKAKPRLETPRIKGKSRGKEFADWMEGATMNYHRHNQNYKPDRESRDRMSCLLFWLVLAIVFCLFMWRLG